MVGVSQVSGGAHLGGALVGVVAWLLWRINGGARDESAGFDGAYLRESGNASAGDIRDFIRFVRASSR
jgi:hypothetical protein